MRGISQVPKSKSRRRVKRGSQWLLSSLLVTTVVAAAVILALRSEPSAVGKRSEPATQISLLLDGSFSGRFGGEMVATRQGFFASDVTVRAEPNDPDFVATVAREHAIGVTSGQSFLLAAWRGVPVTAFAASFLDTPTVIFTLERSGLRRPADLIGKRVGYRMASEGDVVFDAMMAQLGLPRSQITKMPDRDTLDALGAGEVDAIIGGIDEQPDPSSSAFVKLNVIKPQDYGIHVPGQIYFASNDLLHDRPSVIADVLQAIIRGWQFTYADYARSVPVLIGMGLTTTNSERLKFELQQQRPLVMPTGGRIGDYDESRWRTLRDILLFAKLGEEGVPLAQAVDYQFLRDVYRRSPDLAAPGAWSAGK